MASKVNVPQEFTERHDPQFIEFDTEGMTVGGVLMSIEKIDVAKKDNDGKPLMDGQGQPLTQKALRYTLFDLDAERDGKNPLSCFLGTHQINSKIRPTDKGKLMMVRFEGKDNNVQKNGNAMKVFRVFISNLPARKDLVAATQITDEDISF